MAELTLEQQKALALAKARVRAKAPKTGVVEQGMSGVNEGLANFLGFPVDAATNAINLGVSGVNKVAGTDIAPIIDPVGGSGSFNRLLAPTISKTAPQTTAQRYARRIGQEVGFGAPAAMTGAAIPGFGAVARANMPAYLAASASGDIGAGVAGQTAQELLPENKFAQIAATLLGGIGGSGAVSMMMPAAKAPSLADTKAQASARWDRVNSSDARLTDQATDELRTVIRGALPASQMAPDAYPNAFRMAGRMDDVVTPSIGEVGDIRRMVGDAVAANPNESRVGVEMKKAISEYLAGLSPNKVSGDASVVDDLTEATKLTARVKKAEAILNKEMRAERRAATSGTGGNEVNAKRQNIGALLDIERDPTLSGRRQGFTPDEVALMEKIAFGSKGQNLARLVGRLSPTSGALPLMFGSSAMGAGATGFLASGNPLTLIPASLPLAGMVGKGVAEASTNKDIQRLMATILSGGKPRPSSAADAAKAAIVQQLLTGSIENRPQ